MRSPASSWSPSLAPLVFTDFFVSVILTKALWLGVAAASLIFLSAYGGMVSLAQVGIYGVAGMTFANLVAADGGNAGGVGPVARAAIAALVVATAVGLVLRRDRAPAARASTS